MAAMKARFGDKLETPNDLSVPEYDAVLAYAEAVAKAGSTATDKVIPALASVTVDGPRGAITMDKERHAALSMYLGQVMPDGSVKVISEFKNEDPGEQCPNLK